MPILGPTVGMPPGSKVEIEFTPGVWTDVTTDVERDPFTIRRGRTSEFSDAQTGTLDGLRLNNTTGKYSPLSQVLSDGTPNPYYPNILPRKRIRYSNTAAGPRFVGFIKSWPPFVDTNGFSWVTITATDRLDQGNRVFLKSPITQEVSTSQPLWSWALTDAVDSSSGVEASGKSPIPIVNLSQAPLVFGDNGPGYGDGTGVKFAPTAVVNGGQYLYQRFIPATVLTSWSFEIWVNPGTSRPAWTSEEFLGFSDREAGSRTVMAHLGILSGVPYFIGDYGFLFYFGPTSIADGKWHHIVLTGGGTNGFYVDGALVATHSLYSFPLAWMSVGAWGPPAQFPELYYRGNVGHVQVYDRELSSAEVAVHWSATTGYSGDRTDQRIARWLATAGLTSADWALDAGKCVVGTYPQAGKSIVAACQDMATSEGGGAAFYVDMSGACKFVNRWFRKPGDPSMTVDAEADLDGTAYVPSFDELNLTNQVTVTRSGESGVLSTQTDNDLTSQTLYGLSSGTVDTFTVDDRDALALAQSQVAALSYPGFRLSQVVVDLLTATTAGLYTAITGTRIGSRIRVTNLPKARGPATQVDLIVEGWTETIGTDQYSIAFDTSPADCPPRGVYDDTTWGRYQASGQTLNASLTSSATTVVIATGAGLPTFTTVSARYPLSIQIGAEVMTLTSAPGGATSPQTFTGVTRAVAGTTAAAQSSGAGVQLWPAVTYTL